MSHSLAKWSASRANLRAAEMQMELQQATQFEEDPVVGVEVVELADEATEEEENEEESEIRSLHEFIIYITQHMVFTGIVMLTIFLNALTIALETTSLKDDGGTASWLEYIDFVFLGIYTIEFLLKVYAEPRGYWGSGYNRFDFFILVVSFVQLAFTGMDVADFTFLRVVRALRALRALRSISFIRSLQVIVNALIQTFRTSVLDLVLLLFLGMYLFAIMGYYFFGYDEDADPEQWGTLGRALMSLFTYVTADGWTDLQRRLSDLGFSGSAWFTIIFIFFGHFIFTNLFIGVIIQNIEEATRADKAEQLSTRMENLNQKKAFILQRQQEDIANLLEKQQDFEFEDIQDMIKHLAGTLRHDDLVPFRHISGNLSWLDTFLTTLDHQEHTMYRLQQVHFEVANTLAETLERQLTTRKRVDGDELGSREY